jgi:hypothetical protein
MPIANTTLEALTPRLVALIEVIAPRIIEGQASCWKHYDLAQGVASRSRLFTILWGPGRHQTGGYFTHANVETRATLIVRADYAARQQSNLFLVQDDWSQLRDVLNSLTDDITTGLVSIFQTASPPSVAQDTPLGRQRLSAAAAQNTSTIKIDHTFDLTYMQARA